MADSKNHSKSVIALNDESLAMMHFLDEIISANPFSTVAILPTRDHYCYHAWYFCKLKDFSVLSRSFYCLVITWKSSIYKYKQQVLIKYKILYFNSWPT